VRPIRPDDAAALEALVAGTPYADLARRTVAHPSAEQRALILERRGAVTGVVLFGVIAGTEGTARIQGVVSEHDADALVAGAVAALAARKVVAEVPDDAHHSAMMNALVANGFTEAARIADYVRDGVALVVLER
jgi:hypothetical protein